MVPTHLQSDALIDFDEEVRGTFCKITGLLPDNAQWAQACRGFKHAGLGFRSAARHGEAAYLASSCAARDTCKLLLPTFSLDADSPASNFGTNLSAYNAKLPDDAHLSAQAVIGRSQKSLSEALDKNGHEARLRDACITDRATLISECQIGAKEFWQVIPNKSLGLAVPAEEFVCEDRHRLCMLENPTDDWCPLCDQVLDARGLHARTCCAGGDRTRRHN